MDDIATAAGLTKRTLYNNYPDKEMIFKHTVEEITKFAGAFARGLEDRFNVVTARDLLEPALYTLAEELALSIIRTEVVAIRRLLIGEAVTFPAMAAEYFDAAPGHVIKALTNGFARLAKKGMIRTNDPKRAAAQFAYLVAGEHIDQAMLIGTVPPKKEILACAREGVKTFLARYAV
jgi:TetR/AcrR family transcriptional repressor of mexJK operon